MARDTGPDRATRLLVHERDQSACVRCGKSADPWDMQVHHRRPRGMGGSKDPETNSPANLIVVDPACHSWIEEHRMEASSDGFLVPQRESPSKWPVRHARLGFVFLLDDGSTQPVPKPREVRSGRSGILFEPRRVSPPADKDGAA
jgi:5-methylcytosine-specific restriction protein A